MRVKDDLAGTETEVEASGPSFPSMTAGRSLMQEPGLRQALSARDLNGGPSV